MEQITATIMQAVHIAQMYNAHLLILEHNKKISQNPPATFTEILKNVACTFVPLKNLHPQTILNTTQQYPLQWLIMPTAKRSLAEKVFRKTCLEHIIANLKSCPLICVPTNIQFQEITQLVYATTLSTPPHIISMLSAFATYNKLPIQFVHVIEEETRSYTIEVIKFKEVLQANLHSGISYEIIEIYNPSIEEGLIQHLKKYNNAALAVFETQQKSITNFFNLNLTHELVHNQTIFPIIIFHPGCLKNNTHNS